jgi:hypothetical protein
VLEPVEQRIMVAAGVLFLVLTMLTATVSILVALFIGRPLRMGRRHVAVL